MRMRKWWRVLVVAAGIGTAGTVRAESAREVIAKAMATQDADEQVQMVNTLAGTADTAVPDLLTIWKEGGAYLASIPDGGWKDLPAGTRVAVTLAEAKDEGGRQVASLVSTGGPLLDAGGQAVRLTATDLEAVDTNSDLRQAMRTVLDLGAMNDPDPARRRVTIEAIGIGGDPAKLPALQARTKVEKDPAAQQALRLSIALLDLRSEDANAKIAAVRTLGATHALAARDILGVLERETAGSQPALAAEAHQALAAIDQHLRWVNFYGTLFRGLAAASVLLVVAVGLAVTFGVMGVINMAHGELIAAGAYTAYLVQNVFANGVQLSPFGWSVRLPGMHATGWWYECYFLFALPFSFLAAAVVGALLERGVIRFLYRRPLESLLATWGVSLVLQQCFRLVFGANNVQVDSPTWLSGNWTVFDVSLGWNRLFVIAFAVAILAGTWLLLNKMPLGLLIRAVTQNRAMAACMGVRTARVDILTFAFGSGLAGLAGAFLSQIGNVGPSLGQNYIVDSFMTVVVGGVGSLFGTVISALGIGVTDQGLQQYLGNPVMGKILVLSAIILFLQWRPSGLFAVRSRNLES